MVQFFKVSKSKILWTGILTVLGFIIGRLNFASICNVGTPCNQSAMYYLTNSLGYIFGGKLGWYIAGTLQEVLNVKTLIPTLILLLLGFIIIVLYNFVLVSLAYFIFKLERE
jgi:hypothetical protein